MAGASSEALIWSARQRGDSARTKGPPSWPGGSAHPELPAADRRARQARIEKPKLIIPVGRQRRQVLDHELAPAGGEIERARRGGARRAVGCGVQNGHADRTEGIAVDRGPG